MAVSYTHLDVYKRQTVLCVLWQMKKLSYARKKVVAANSQLSILNSELKLSLIHISVFVNSISAEARFYRAIFYYHLFMGYEQFPLIKHYLATSEMYSVAKGTQMCIRDS